MNEPLMLCSPWLCLVGIIGVAVGYLLVFWNAHFHEHVLTNKFDWRVVLSGLIFILLIGGCYVAFVLEPETNRQAFLGGMTAEGFFVGQLQQKKLRRKSG